MSQWEGSLEQRNVEALKRWRLHSNLVKSHGVNPFPDARRPCERAYFEFAQERKLEVAHSFLARLKFTGCWGIGTPQWLRYTRSGS